MIQQLALPPRTIGILVDPTVGTIQHYVPASNVVLNSGTLVPSLPLTFGGTLVDEMSQISLGSFMDWAAYKQRDLELAGRDHVVASAIVKVAATAATIFGTRVDRPIQLALADTILPDSELDHSVVSPEGTLQLVVPSSVPFDATFSDRDLYGRDLVLHESLVRMSSIFDVPCITSAGTSVTTISDVWSYGEASPVSQTISPVLRLDTTLFSTQDRSLAYSDNNLGVYVANLEKFLTNPLNTAEQLIISSDGSGTLSMEPEVYVHDASQDTGTLRTWVAEPQLPGRMKITYNTDTQLLRWYPPDSNLVHVPQPQPFTNHTTTISGPDCELTFGLDVLGRKDSAFYAYKASQIVVQNRALREQCLISGAYSAGIDQGNVVQNVYLTRDNPVRLESIPTFGPATLHVGLTIIPQAYLEVLGCQFPELDLDPSDGGGLFPAGTTTTAQYPVDVLAGNYQVDVSYTNYGGDTPEDFPIYIGFGTTLITSSPLAFGSSGYSDGDVVTKSFNILSDGTLNNLVVLWSGPVSSSSQLKILSVKIRSSSTSALSLKLKCQLMDGDTLVGSQTFDFNGLRDRPDCAIFKFEVENEVTSPSFLVQMANNLDLVAMAINQVHVATLDLITLTPNSEGFDGYPMSMLPRAVDSVVDSFLSISDYQDPRVGTSWTPQSTQSWVNQIRNKETRLDWAFKVGGPLDVGKPALLPKGIKYHMSTGTIQADQDDTRPELRSITAWMLTQRFLVAHDTFLGYGPTEWPAGSSPIPPVPTPPNPPFNLTLDTSAGTFDLAWEDGSTDETGFVIQWSFDSVTWYTYGSVGEDVTSASLATVAVPGPQANVLIYWRVYAYNGVGNSDPSNVVSGTVVDNDRVDTNKMVIDYAGVESRVQAAQADKVVIDYAGIESRVQAAQADRFVMEYSGVESNIEAAQADRFVVTVIVMET